LLQVLLLLWAHPSLRFSPPPLPWTTSSSNRCTPSLA
jgi:hypothetical protein